MTAQVSDSVKYEDRRYSLAGQRGSGLFDPAARGLSPKPASTANWRGFCCEYAVVAGRLELATLRINVKERAPIFGVEPGGPGPGGLLYKNLRAPMAFTGGLLIGHEFIHELYVHGGFHPAYKYRVVYELIFEGGRLVRASDQSAAMVKVRELLKGKLFERGPGPSSEEIAAWIERAASSAHGRS